MDDQPLSPNDRLKKALNDLRGPHDEEACETAARHALAIENEERKRRYRHVFDRGFRAGFAAGRKSANDTSDKGAK